MSNHVPCKTAYIAAHMRVHLATSFWLIPPNKILVDRFDDELDLQNQEELWMSDEEPTDLSFKT
jgi:hypothetical protein